VNSAPEPAASSIGLDPAMLTTHYEAARALAVGDSTHGQVIGLTVLYRWGLPAWMHLVQHAPPHPKPVTGTRATASTATTHGANSAATVLIIASMLLAFSKESNQCMPRWN
jgi:hypothetical protein